MIPNELKSIKPMSGKERLGANRDSEYLGAEDIEPGTEPVLTIKALYNGMITLARGKERHDVIVFVEEKIPGMINQVRPLVVNATNRKTLRKLYKAVDAQTLVGKKVKLYLEHNVRDPSTGDKVDGIRIRPSVPDGKAPEAVKCADCGKNIVGMGNFTAEQIIENAKKKYGKALCVECSQKAKAELDAQVAADQAAAELAAKESAEQAEQEAAEQEAKENAAAGNQDSDLAAELLAEAGE